MPGEGLDRFVTAQKGVFETALAELERGRKENHWMWFIFPQIAGLGSSPMARLYAIRSRAEAEDYLDHPLLGVRLRRCTAAVLVHAGRPAEAVFGPVDAVKFRSSMTLFEAASAGGEPLFADALRAFYGGERDPETLRRLT